MGRVFQSRQMEPGQWKLDVCTWASLMDALKSIEGQVLCCRQA